MSRWGMVIDLRKCIACYACTIACKQANFVPKGVYFNRVVVTEKGDFPLTRRVKYPTMCNHCEDATCVDVCPSGATYKREDGIVGIDPDKCTGCQYCILACPYHQRTYLEKNEPYWEERVTEYEKIGRMIHPYTEGTVIKCDFCMKRIDQGLRKGLVPGVDREATPACVNVCMVHCRYFGDLDDPNSQVSKLIKEHNVHTLLPESGNGPSVYYIER